MELDAMIGVAFVVDYMMILFEEKFFREGILWPRVCVMNGGVPRFGGRTQMTVSKIVK